MQTTKQMPPRSLIYTYACSYLLPRPSWHLCRLNLNGSVTFCNIIAIAKRHEWPWIPGVVNSQLKRFRHRGGIRQVDGRTGCRGNTWRENTDVGTNRGETEPAAYSKALAMVTLHQESEMGPSNYLRTCRKTPQVSEGVHGLSALPLFDTVYLMLPLTSTVWCVHCV